jgi:hypothetical protein
VNASNEGNARRLIKICSAPAAEDPLARHCLNASSACPSEAVRCLRGERAVKFEYQGVTRQPYSAARNGMGEGCTAADSCLA